jgi:hypothetical protein
MVDSPKGFAQVKLNPNIQLLPYPLATSASTVGRDLRERPSAQRFPGGC